MTWSADNGDPWLDAPISDVLALAARSPRLHVAAGTTDLLSALAELDDVGKTLPVQLRGLGLDPSLQSRYGDWPSSPRTAVIGVPVTAAVATAFDFAKRLQQVYPLEAAPAGLLAFAVLSIPSGGAARLVAELAESERDQLIEKVQRELLGKVLEGWQYQTVAYLRHHIYDELPNTIDDAYQCLHELAGPSFPPVLSTAAVLLELLRHRNDRTLQKLRADNPAFGIFLARLATLASDPSETACTCGDHKVCPRPEIILSSQVCRAMSLTIDVFQEFDAKHLRHIDSGPFLCSALMSTTGADALQACGPINQSDVRRAFTWRFLGGAADDFDRFTRATVRTTHQAS